MVYLFCIVLITVFFVITCYLKNKQLPFIIFAISGVMVLFASSLLYSLRMSGIYNSSVFLNFRFIYRFAAMIRISFSQIYRVMELGCFLIFLSCTSITFSMLQKPKKKYIALVLLPLFVHLLVNDPELNFILYLKHSSGEPVSHLLSMINVYNTILTVIYFIMPVVATGWYYKKTTLMIKKRHSVLMLIYTIIYYTLILVMNMTGLIRFFQFSDISILRFNVPNISDFTFSAVVMFACLIMSIIVIFMLKTSRMQNYSAKSFAKNKTGIDKNLRMILHTYKNHFFAINQQINFLKSLDEPYSENAKVIFDAIEEVSKNSIDEISDRINALKNVKMTYRPVDLNECITKAVEKVFIPQSIQIIKEYSEAETVILSESAYIVEMIANLIQNSVDAIAAKNSAEDDFSIILRTVSENDWVLFEIEDNGCGIAEKEKKKLFEPLVSGKQGKNNFGIGLHYVKKVVSAHRGYIFVDSVPGKYTKFQIYLRKNNVNTVVKN